MKTIGFSLMLVCGFQASLQAQTNSPPASANTNAPAASVAPAIVGRSADSRVWARISSQTNASGQVSLVTNKAYTELASGLCVRGPDGAWTDAAPVIAPDNVLGGASATGARHRVHFAIDANTASGAIHLVAPDGKVFDSRVYGLSYRDSATGSNILIAWLQSSQGQLLGKQRVVYLNAFSNLQADLEYVYTLAGLEQNLVLRESPASPAAYGLNPATTKLQLYTEFFSPPAPVKTSIQRNNTAEDILLDFGAAKIGMGQVFSVQAQGQRTAIPKGRVAKHWTQLDGNRQFLIEEIPYRAISNALQKLPLHAANGTPGKDSIQRTASLFPLRPPGVGVAAKPGVPILVAKAETGGPGLLLDYSMVGANLTNYLFTADQTFLISANTYLFGASNIFEGGTVIKYSDSGSLIAAEAPFVFNTGPYRPAVFTSANDGSVGQPVSAPFYSGLGCYLQTWSALDNVVISRVRISYAGTGFDAVNDDSDVFRHCQFVQCQNAVELDSATWAYLGNILLSGCGGGLVLGNQPGITAEYLTMQGGTFDVYDSASASSIYNAILYNTQWPGPDPNVYSLLGCAVCWGGDVFQAAGAGLYYLPVDSTNHGASYGWQDQTTYGDLQSMTTYPPTMASGTIGANTNYSPCTPRDTSAHDIGYHYDAMDFVLSNLSVNAGVTMTLTNGVVVGVVGGYGYVTNGFDVNGSLVSQGAPNNMNLLAPALVTQEQPAPNGGLVIGGNGTWQNVMLRFTELPGLGGGTCYITASDVTGYGPSTTNAGPVTLRDCRLNGGFITMDLGHNPYLIDTPATATLNLSNNVLERCAVNLWRSPQPWYDTYLPGNLVVNAYNNLFWNGSLNIIFNMATGEPASGPWRWGVYDNLFDSVSFSETGSDGINGTTWPGMMNNGHNGYVSTTAWRGSSGGDVTPAGADFQAGALGNYYYPTNGGNLSTLIHEGSTSATNLGLYHYTVTTNNVIEGPNNVSIGFHYVATDASGNPLDTYWLGIPDYLADSNGALGAWEMCYFGHLGLDPNASDGQGNTLLYDYQHALEPTIISFQISFTNQYVNRANAPLSLAIQSGVPYYWAVLLDNTNFGGASWTAYTSSNITANLGTVQGWHTVWVGLSGRPAGSQAAWNAVRLDLDLTAPILTVTNALSVTIPMIQLQGYANEELAWITYDLNNATGSVSNQPGFMTGAIFDTNSFTYTNDSFKCFDLVLASGANRVTLHAADLAGHLTTSNFVFNLNYSNKPAPVVTLWWPQNGAQISGSSFTWRGTVDDPTVTLSAQITDTNGDVNVVAGVIERNGNFWVDNLPLAPGTNWLTLTAVDINNNTNTTNIYVVQSGVGLSITTSDAITTQTAIGVSGTIGTNGYLVWVNGVLANQSGGNWTAYNVPVNGDGVQVIQACAIPDTQTDNYGYGTGSGGGGTNSSLSNPGNPSARDAVCAEYNPEKEPVIICVGYHQSWSGQGGITNNYWQSSETINWSPTGGGSIVSNYSLTYYSDWLTSQTQSQWDSNGVGSTVTTSTGFVNGVTNNPTPITNAYDGPTSFGGLQGQTYGMDAGSGSPAATGSITAMPDYLLEAQGYGLSGWQRLLWLSLGASQVVDPWYPAMPESWDYYEGDPFYWDISSTPVPYSQQMILGHREGSDGFLVTTVPSDAVIKVQLMVLGQSSDTVSPSVADGDPVITASSIALDPANVNPGAAFCVGQNVPFTLNVPSGVTATNVQWSLGGTFVNAHTNAVPGGSEPNSSEVYFMNTNFLKYQTVTNCWWTSGGANPPATYQASVSFTLIFTNGEPPLSGHANGTFTMYRPTLTNWTQIGQAIVTNYTSGIYEVVQVGTPSGANGMGYMTYVLSTYAGEAGITQVYNDQSVPTSYGSNVLDNAVMYPFQGPNNIDPTRSLSANSLKFNDTPSEPGSRILWNSVSLVLQFSDYVRFMPGAGNGPNIYVTLGKVTWNVNATATYTNGAWVLNPGKPVVPSWGPSQEFPYWTTLHSY